MYLPQHFRLDDEPALDMAAGVGVGHLITSVGGVIESSFVPFLVDRADKDVVVRAHLARANKHHAAIGAGAEALLVVTGPDAYVSPNWYPSKAEHGKVVPTWNYSLVHLRGVLRVVDDRGVLLDIVRRLTDRHESAQVQPWSVDDAPADYIDAQLRAIVGVEMVVTSVEGKAKLSQNRSDSDREGVRRGLTAGGPSQQAVARAMG
ncbi:MAG: FMN-binding negative transcriptional regulator [Ilumatobacteraceae bacterium]